MYLTPVSWAYYYRKTPFLRYLGMAHILIHKLVCRGADRDNPQAWLVVGTAMDCTQVHVRFSDLEHGSETHISSSVVTASCRKTTEPFYEVKCSGEEALWIARFEDIEHKELRHLRRWLRENPDVRAVKIQAWAGDWTKPVQPAETLFKDPQIILGYEFEAGVLLVHGIGQHQPGHTILRFGEPVVDFLQRWIRGFTDNVAKRCLLEKAEALKNKAYEGVLRNRQDLWGMTAELDRFVQKAQSVNTSRSRAPVILLDDPKDIGNAETNQVLVGNVRVEDTVVGLTESQSDTTGAALLRLSTLDKEGKLSESHVLMTEAWWTHKAVPPDLLELVKWIWWALPIIISSNVAVTLERSRQAAKTSKKYAVKVLASLGWFLKLNFLTPIAMLGCVGLQFLFTVLMVPMLLPIGQVRKIVGWVFQVLMWTIGQSWALKNSAIRRSAIVRQVSRNLEWLCERCEKVIVMAHSQGAEVSRIILGSRRWNQVEEWITFGSGIKILATLEREQKPVYSTLILTNLIVTCLFSGWIAWVFHPHLLYELFPQLITNGMEQSSWAIGILLYVAFLLVARAYAKPPQHLSTLRKSIPWTDYYSTHDPVSCGSLVNSQEIRMKNLPFSFIEIYNKASVLRDHTSYFENIEEFVAPVALKIARLAGVELAQLQADDHLRLERAQQQRKKNVRKRALLRTVAMTCFCSAALLLLGMHWPEWMESLFIHFTPQKVTMDIRWKDITEGILSRHFFWETLPLTTIFALYILERLILQQQAKLNYLGLVTRNDPPGKASLRHLRWICFPVVAFLLVLWVKTDNHGAFFMSVFSVHF